MPEELDSFDETVPHAAGKADLFLQVIRQRAVEHELGLDFRPEQVRKTGEVILKAKLPTSGNVWTTGKSLELDLVVHASPIASALQVGWQIAEEGRGFLDQNVSRGFLAGVADRQAAVYEQRRSKSQDAGYQRQLRGIIGAFHSLVFMPTLQDLVAAAEASSRRPTGQGFLGAE